METPTIILIVVMILSGSGLAYFFILRGAKKAKQPVKLDYTNWIQWKNAETELLRKINEYRIAIGHSPLSSNDDMKRLADNRTAYWKKMRFTKDDNLHRNFLRDRKPYLDKGWHNISENASLGYRKVFEKWSESPSHNRNMLGDWTYAGVSVITNFDGKQLTCLILGK